MSDRNKAPKLLIGARTLKIMFALGFFSAIMVYFSPPRPTPAQTGPVKAEPYQWPQGCEQKPYKRWDKISQNCKEDRYLLTWKLATHLGMQGAKVRGSLIKYYRLGNDAVSIDCRKNYCEIELIYNNKFYQDK